MIASERDFGPCQRRQWVFGAATARRSRDRGDPRQDGAESFPQRRQAQGVALSRLAELVPANAGGRHLRDAIIGDARDKLLVFMRRRDAPVRLPSKATTPALYIFAYTKCVAHRVIEPLKCRLHFPRRTEWARSSITSRPRWTFVIEAEDGVKPPRHISTLLA